MKQYNFLESPIQIRNLRDAVVETDWQGCINCDSITYYAAGGRRRKLPGTALQHRLERFRINLQHALHGNRFHLVWIMEDYFDEYSQSYKAPHATILLGRLPLHSLVNKYGSPESVIQWLHIVLERSGLKVKDNLIRLNFSDINFWHFIADEQERKQYIWYETKRLDAGLTVNNSQMGFSKYWINSVRRRMKV